MRFQFAQKPSFRSAIHLQKKNGSLPPAQSPLRQNLWITGFFFRLHLLSTLATLPHGVLQRTPEIIQLSSNLATVRQLGDDVEIVESLRASSQALLIEGRDLVVHTADRASFQSSQQDYYPPWESAKDVPLHALFAQTYQSLFQQPGIMENVHAGVECSILQERCPFIQEMISIGPTIRCAHTVQENVNLSSIDRVYQLLKAVLQQLPN